jgi:hypothetical protein
LNISRRKSLTGAGLDENSLHGRKGIYPVISRWLNDLDHVGKNVANGRTQEGKNNQHNNHNHHQN